MSSVLEKRVQEALDQGTLEADAELRELLGADTAEARAALSLVEIDQALRGMARPASERSERGFDVGAVLARLDAALDDIGDVTAAPSFDEDVGPVSDAGAAGGAAGGAKVVDLASRRRWNAPLWLGGGLAAAAAFGLVMTTGILNEPAREAASVGSYAAQESAAESFAPPAAAPMADPEAAPPADEPAVFADESLELERRQANAAPASVAAAEQQPVEEAEAADFGIVDSLAGGGRATSAGLRGSVGDTAGFDGEADESNDTDRAEGQIVARTRRARAIGGVSAETAMLAEASMMNSQYSPDLPAAPSTTSAVQEQGSSLSARVMACVSGSELVVTLSARDGQVVRTQPSRTLSAEERRCVDRILLGSAQSVATQRMTFRR